MSNNKHIEGITQGATYEYYYTVSVYTLLIQYYYTFKT